MKQKTQDSPTHQAFNNSRRGDGSRERHEPTGRGRRAPSTHSNGDCCRTSIIPTISALGRALFRQTKKKAPMVDRCTKHQPSAYLRPSSFHCHSIIGGAPAPIVKEAMISLAWLRGGGRPECSDVDAVSPTASEGGVYKAALGPQHTPQAPLLFGRRRSTGQRLQ